MPAKPLKLGAGSLVWLVGCYRESSAWSRLSPATRRQRENILRGVLAKTGDMPVSAITRAKMIKSREDLAFIIGERGPDGERGFHKLVPEGVRYSGGSGERPRSPQG